MHWISIAKFFELVCLIVYHAICQWGTVFAVSIATFKKGTYTTYPTNTWIPVSVSQGLKRKKAIIQLFNQVAHLFFWQLRCMRHLELGANLGFSTVSRWFSLLDVLSHPQKNIKRHEKLVTDIEYSYSGKYISQNNMLIRSPKWIILVCTYQSKAVPCSTARIHALSHKHFHLEETNTTQQPWISSGSRKVGWVAKVTLTNDTLGVRGLI